MNVDYYMFEEAVRLSGHEGGVSITYENPYNITDEEIKKSLENTNVSFKKFNQSLNKIISEIPMRRLRQMRDMLLKDTDWWAVSDRTMSQEQLDYRKALRDITKTASPEIDEFGNLTNVNFPVKP